MNYLLAVILAGTGLALLFWNKPLSKKLGIFFTQRFSEQFGKLAHILGWDNPNTLYNRFMYRGAVILGGLILLVFAFTAFFGPIYTGSAAYLG